MRESTVSKTRAMRRMGGLVGVVALALGLAVAPPSRADDGEPVTDNGAEGRTDSLNEGDVPPIEACNTQPNEAGSRIERPVIAGPEELAEDEDDDSYAFTTGLCVYLPPGYDDDGLQYPVLYLLHGGGGDAGDWVTFGDVQQIVDDAGGELIVVMPDGTNGLWYDAPDGSLRNETYVIDHVIPFVDEHYRTIGAREGRAIAGLSNGGLGAMVLAAKHPDLFVAATSMSGNLGGYLHEYDQQNRPLYHDGNTPTPLASNLDLVALNVRWGATCSPTGDLQEDLCASWGFEQLFRYDNQLFHSTLDALGTEHVYKETEGSHAWRWWSAWLRDDHLPFLLDHLDDALPDGPLSGPAVGFRWDYKTISERFSVWGYDFVVDRDVADEWLEITDADFRSMTLTGSGVVNVHTPQGEWLLVNLGAGSTRTIQA